MPGVVAVFPAAETAALGHNPTPTEIFDAEGRRHVEPPRLPIAPGRVRHVGEIVAMVVAETAHQARDAADAHDLATAHYRAWIKAGDPEGFAAAVAELRGKDLACYCAPHLPCHADVLLEIANAPLRCEAADA